MDTTSELAGLSHYPFIAERQSRNCLFASHNVIITNMIVIDMQIPFVSDHSDDNWRHSRVLYGEMET